MSKVNLGFVYRPHHGVTVRYVIESDEHLSIDQIFELIGHERIGYADDIINLNSKEWIKHRRPTDNLDKTVEIQAFNDVKEHPMSITEFSCAVDALIDWMIS